MPEPHGYVEFDEDAEISRRQAAEPDDVKSWLDREVRRRVGELIARAMMQARKPEPQKFGSRESPARESRAR